VALQHFLAMAGLALVFKFVSEGTSEGKRLALFLGFFCFGLALWDKALFVWFFSGLVVATLVVFPRELWARCSLKNLGLAAAGLCLGAAPLVAYNSSSNQATFRANSPFDLAQFPTRLHALRVTWDGQILWGYMVHAPWSPGAPRVPGTAVERIAAVVHSLAGHPLSQPAWCRLSGWRSRWRPCCA
jgi:4-amino-4-deoxy-L-arabinose transferase-like glycosyltransferase